MYRHSVTTGLVIVIILHVALVFPRCKIIAFWFQIVERLIFDSIGGVPSFFLRITHPCIASFSQFAQYIGHKPQENQVPNPHKSTVPLGSLLKTFLLSLA